MPAIRFQATLFTIDSWTILHLPEEASLKLPSRGQVMVNGTINGFDFQAPLEPDGKWGHWLKVDTAMKEAIGVKAGDKVTVMIEPTKEWPEPDMPKDIQNALDDDPQAYNLWKKVTPMARWEWIRWIRGTAQQETRKRRIEVAMSKLKSGERRPCCWNRALCTESAVSKSGVLREPASN
jgi:hypothetical protein